MKTRAPTTTSPVRRTPRPALARKATPGAQEANGEVVRTILRQAGAQPQVAVSNPGDTFEREADRVADRISSGLPAPLISRLPSASVDRAAKPEEEKKKKAQRKETRKPEDDSKKRAQRKETKKSEDDSKKRAQRKETKKPEDDSKKRAQRKEASAGPTLEETAERAIGSKGAGRPLEPATRATLEGGMGVDLGAVRVHDDPGARSAAQALNARAFTHGNDIWLGPGESQRDTRLMAHEATHVVQQQSEITQRLVQRDGPSPAGGAPAAEVFPVDVFDLPHIKSRHQSLYQGWASSSRLQRQRGYSRDAEGDPGQQGIWLAAPQTMPPATELTRLGIDLANPQDKEIKINNRPITLPRDQLARNLRIPTWDRDGNSGQNFQVDHIIELQVAGWPGRREGNELQNMELLDQRSNGSAGGSTRLAVRDSVKAQLERNTAASGPPRTATEAEITDVLDTKQVVFRGVSGGPRGRRPEALSRWWTLAEIQAGDHLERATPFRNIGEVGRANAFSIVSPTRTIEIAEFPHGVDELHIPVTRPVLQNRIGGLTISSIDLVPNYSAVTGIGKVGDLHATWNLPPGITPATPEVTIELKRHSQYAGFLGDLPPMGGDMPGASPVEFSPPHIQDGKVMAQGQLRPTIPLLGDRPIDLRIVGRDIELGYAFDVGAIRLPIPGVTIDDSSLFLFFGTRGLGAEGRIVFSVNRLGSGSITAAISTERGFEATGRFQFDRRLFDRAEIEVWYRDRAFGGRGTIGIDDPNKIRGIRSAEVTVGYDAGVFSASGRVSPSIRGVQEAGLTITHSEAEGLVIGGNLQLTNDIPGIRSGSVDVTLRKQEEAWKVSATGRAQPAIPGIDSELTVAYDDGAFTASFSGAFRRGMLSGTANVGVTNRTLDASGEPTGDPDPNGPLIVYGGGSATVQIAPWLQGTAGLQFAPNGEVTLSGEIGLPSQLEIFSRKQIDKSLLNIAVQVPIFPGIVAEIGGGLSAQAGIGPGVIDQLRIGITYNPAHEDQTHVTGDAHLNIPADAGLRLAVRAGIGLGITGASATGGLEIGGMAGIGGAAEAGVHLDWTPATGLTIDAHGELHAEPKFRFDISGYVSVRALGFEVYGNRWEFASYEFGSNMRFGVRFPIHYVQGQPFDISLSDVEFQVPEVNPRQLLDGLIDRIA